MTVTVRTATSADARAIARVRVDAWRSSRVGGAFDQPGTPLIDLLCGRVLDEVYAMEQVSRTNESTRATPTCRTPPRWRR